MRVGSLFSGIGGLELGLERAGMKTIWQSEMDDYASRVLAKNFPGVPNLGDITQIDWRRVERPDLVCGGFPCQPASAAGKRLGMADARWLWPEFARCLRELRPRWVLAENVPGLLSIDSGRGFGSVLRDLAEFGFDAEWGRIPAAAVGAPHLRWRVFLVAHADNSGLERRQLLSERSDQRTLGESGLADTNSSGRNGRPGLRRPGRGREPADGGLDDTNRGRHVSPEGQVCPRRATEPGVRGVVDGLFEGVDGTWIAGEWPGVPRVSNGVPDRVNRLRCLGNAVVPQVAEVVGRWIMEQERVSA